MSKKKSTPVKHVPDSGSPFCDLGQSGHVMSIGETNTGKGFLLAEILRNLNLPDFKPKGTLE